MTGIDPAEGEVVVSIEGLDKGMMCLALAGGLLDEEA